MGSSFPRADINLSRPSHLFARNTGEEFGGDFQAVLTENFAEFKELSAKIEEIDELIKSQSN